MLGSIVPIYAKKGFGRQLAPVYSVSCSGEPLWETPRV